MKPVAVKEYSRKDGTAVRAHGRRKQGRFTVVGGLRYAVVPTDAFDAIYEFSDEWANAMYEFSGEEEAWAKADALNAMTPDELAREFEVSHPLKVTDIMRLHGVDEEGALDLVASVLHDFRG